MPRILLSLSCCLFLTPAAVLAGAMAPPPPFAFTLARADVVVIGTVTAFEAKTVQAERAANWKEKVEYRVAVVKVEEPLLGAKGLTHLKVGLAPPASFRGSGDLLRIVPAADLKVEQKALLVLTRHHSEAFHVLPNQWDVTDANLPEYQVKADLARRVSKLLADPSAGLKAKEAGDRFLTASMLIARYRKPHPGYQQEAVPAAESTAILRALADADWKQADHFHGQQSALSVFYQLGLTEADGWRQPEDFRQMAPAAQKWLRENAVKYHIKKYVPTKAEK